jgi:hypothetical protein
MPHGVKQSLSEGYERFVEPNLNGCWGWSGSISKNPGYGQFRSNMKKWRAHIASWLIFRGDIPEGMCVCHTCDNRVCSNPNHLFLASHFENNLDMIKKGRSPILHKSGSENPNAKLLEKEAKEIKEMLNSGISQKTIARKFKVSQALVSLIKLEKAWR